MASNNADTASGAAERALAEDAKHQAAEAAEALKRYGSYDAAVRALRPETKHGRNAGTDAGEGECKT